MPEGLEGRIALITGGGRGIGAAVAHRLAGAGAAVAVAARSADEVRAVAEAVTAAGGRALPLVGDVRREADVIRWFDEAEAGLGPVTLLVNNAGNAPVGPTAEFSLEAWQSCLDVNLTGAFLCCREAFRRMPAAGGGRIVNVSSGAAKNPHARWAAYSAAKAGLHALTGALAEEGVPLGIRVNTVAPGGTRTAMREAIFGEEPEGAILDPETVAEVVAFLLSDRAAEVRGAHLDVRKPKRH